MTPAELVNLAHLRRARDLIDREYAEPLDVPALARTALMSPVALLPPVPGRLRRDAVQLSDDPADRARQGAPASGRPDASPTCAWRSAAPRSGRSARGSPSSSARARIAPTAAATSRGTRRAPRPASRRFRTPAEQDRRSAAAQPRPSVARHGSRTLAHASSPSTTIDVALAFYRDVLGLDVHTDVTMDGLPLGDARRPGRSRTWRSASMNPHGGRARRTPTPCSR